jgi:hypothetical protein
MDIDKILNEIEVKKVDIKLSDSEKSDIRQNLLKQIRSTNTPVVSPYHSMVQKAYSVTAFAVFAFASMSFAAQSSLPGDLLYPLKIHVNERLVAASKIDPLDRADYEIRLANLRLEELQALKSENKLATTTVEQIRGSYNQHISTARNSANNGNDEKDTRHGGKVKIFADLDVSLNHAKEIFEPKEEEPKEEVKIEAPVVKKVAVKKFKPKHNIVPKKNPTSSSTASTTVNVSQNATITTPINVPVVNQVPAVVQEATQTVDQTVQQVTQTVNNTVNNAVNNTVNNTVQQTVQNVQNTVNNTVQNLPGLLH